MKKIKLNQLEMFVAVVDCGSFNAAAIELGCTQSRISHALAELEESAGARLLERSRAGCTTTEAGRQTLVKARQMLRLADSIVQAAPDSAHIQAVVRLACFRSIGTHVLPHCLEALAAQYPGIQVELDDAGDYADVIGAVEDGSADLGVTRIEANDQLLSYPYLRDAYVLVVSAGLKLSQPFSWAQLDGVPFIQSNNTGSIWILEQCRAAGFQHKPARRLSNDSGILALVERGLGFAILPRLATFPEPPGIRIVDLPISAQRHLAIVARPATAREAAVKIVLKFIRDKRILMKTDVCRAGVAGFDY